MTMLSFPSNPVSPLTYEAWDKGKAALTPETGVGKALKAMRAAWDKVDKNAFLNMTAAVGPAAVKEAKKNMEKAKPALAVAIDALEDLQKLAADKAKTGAKSRTFPDKSVKLLGAIAEAAESRASILRKYADEAEKKADKTLEGIEQRSKHKLELTEKAFTASKDNEKAAKKVNERLAEILKEALLLAKDDRNAAKEKVKLALDQVVALDRLVKKCETDTSEWRFDHSVIDDGTKEIVSKKSEEFILIGKRVALYAQEARTKLQKVHESVGKAN